MQIGQGTGLNGSGDWVAELKFGVSGPNLGVSRLGDRVSELLFGVPEPAPGVSKCPPQWLVFRGGPV